MPVTPPRFATWLLNRFGHPDTLEEVQGDLLELYADWVETVGEAKANWRYSRNALSLLRPLAQSKTAKKYPQPIDVRPAMIRNYVKIAWRNLTHAKVFSLINGFGLTLGMTCALIVFLVIVHETGYDRHHKNGNRIYRIETANNSDPNPHPGTYTEMAVVLPSEVPEFEIITPIYHEWGKTLTNPASGDFFKERVAFTNSEIFRLLDYQWVTGDARTALSQPDQVVLTESYAKKFFGSTDVIGKTIRYDDQEDLRVTGVLKDHPSTTNFPFDILVSFLTLKRVQPDFDAHGWNGFGDNFQVYTLLKPGFWPEQLAGRLHAIQVKYQKDPRTIENQHFLLNPLSELHYSFNFSGRQANSELLNILAVIGVFVLLIACINFINLTTAQALKRAKEIGIRKAVGSNRLSLMYQFLTEAGLITFLSAMSCLLLTWLVLPNIATLMGIPLTASDLFSWKIGLFLAGLAGLTTLLAGTYPAYRLSGMPPIWALKSTRLPQGERSATLRQGLVVVQFTVSMILISCALLINRQLSFFQHADLGFNKAAIITIGLPDNKPEKVKSLRALLMESPQIKDVSFSLNSASAETNWMQGLQYRKGATPIEIKTQMKMGDSHFLDTYGIQLLAGEPLKDTDTSKTSAKIIANQVFLERMGIHRPADAIGQKIYFGDGKEFATIVGVVKNFHVNSLHQKIDPTVIQVVPNNFYQAGIKLQSEAPSTASIQAALGTIEQAWKTTYPNQVFDFAFLDSTLAQAYSNELRTSQLIETSTLIAILIACLGLFGLATFSAEQRTKEIGIRKVLGASVTSIIALMTRDFLKLVAVAMLIASPIAWYAMREWLKNFEFKIGISWWVFALTGALMAVIALVTVSFQSIRAALMNPVKSLRSD